jgi:hypothetical protein
VVAISLWDKKEDSEAYLRGSYPEVLKALAKVVNGTPEVRNFEVANSDPAKDRCSRSRLRQAGRVSRSVGAADPRSLTKRQEESRFRSFW